MPDSRPQRFLLVEFEYEKVCRPSDVSEAPDHRRLAVGFKRVALQQGGEAHPDISFDLSERFPTGFLPIYGLAGPEPWGVWNDGPTSCFLVELPTDIRGDCVLRITHEVYPFAIGERAVSTKVRINGEEMADVRFAGGSAEIQIPRASFISRAQSRSTESDGESPRLSVIIVNYNKWELAAAAVCSVVGSKPRCTYEIIVVDNGSDPSHYAALDGARLPARILRLAERRSFGEANNVAVELAAGEFVLFLNNDAFVQPGCIDRLVEVLINASEVSVVGPVLRYPDGQMQEAGAFLDEGGHDIPLRHFPRVPAGSQSDLGIDYLSGCCLMLRKAEFVGVGGFNPIYEPAYSEDAELCLRLRADGGRVLVQPDAECRHIGGGTQRQIGSDDPRSRASAVNHRVLYSRWERWLVSRDVGDAPSRAGIDLSLWRDETTQARGGERTNVVYTEEPINLDSQSRPTIAVLGALSKLGPSVVATRTPYSRVRMVNLIGAFGVPSNPVSSEDIVSVRSGNAELIVHVAHALPRSKLPFAELEARRILYCPAPTREHAAAQGLVGQSALAALSDYDAIVTDSVSARRTIEDVMRAKQAPMRLIEVVHPPVTLRQGDEPLRKENLVISIGHFRPGPTGGSHASVAGAFDTFRAGSGRGEWRLVCVGDINIDDGASYAALLSDTGGSAVEVRLKPTSQDIVALFAAAKIVVSATGLGGSSNDHAALHSSGADVGTAIAHGCVPVVFHLGPAAETCEYAGIGYRIARPEDIVSALTAAAECADSIGVRPAHLRRMERFSHAAFQEAWRRIVAGEEPYEPTFGGADRFLRSDVAARGRSYSPRRALVVLGSHRSGTSALTRVLSLAGAALPNELMPSAEDNPTGFWEPTRIAALNDDILRSFGSKWSDIFSFVPKPFLAEVGSEAVESARRAIETDFAGEKLVVLKDPRISVLQPLWNMALLQSGYEPFYVITVRNPAEVAASLTQRNGLPHSHGLLLWTSYMVAALRDTSDARRVFIAYEDILKDPQAALDRTERTFRFAFPCRTPASSLAIERFLRPDLRHFFDVAPTIGHFAGVESLYRALLSASRDQPFDSGPLSDAQKWLEELHSVMGPSIAAV